MLNRIIPGRPGAPIPDRAFTTFRVRQPLATHFRRATCAEVDCANFQNGFKINVDTRTPVGRRQAQLIRESGARFTAVRLPDGTADAVFPPGTLCFRPHYRTLFREPLTIVHRGDWRTPAAARAPRAMPAGEWLDRFQTHQQRVIEQAARG